MKKLRLFFIFVVPFCFLVGLWWGLRERELATEDLNLTAKSSLKVLSFRGIFQEPLIHDWAVREKVKIEVMEVNDERSLLRLALNTRGDFDLVVYPSYFLPILKQSKILRSFTPDQFSAFEEISPDFKNLDQSEDLKLGIPILWTVAGMLALDDKVPTNLDSIQDVVELRDVKGRLSLSESPAEILDVYSRLGVVIDEWLDTDQLNQIVNSAKDLTAKIKIKQILTQNDINPELWLQQAPLGVIQSFLENQLPKKHRWFLPREKSSMIVYYLGRSEVSHNADRADELLAEYTKNNVIKSVAAKSLLSTTYKSLDESDLKPYLKSKFVREIAISRIDLMFDSKANQPVWIRSLRSLLPQVFGEMSAEELAQQRADEKSQDKASSDAPAVVGVEDPITLESDEGLNKPKPLVAKKLKPPPPKPQPKSMNELEVVPITEIPEVPGTVPEKDSSSVKDSQSE